MANRKFCTAFCLALNLIACLALTTSLGAGASNSQLLQGRVEEIFNDPNLKVPVELRAVALKLDVPVASGPHIVRLELKSFPATMRGEWKGNLTINKNVFSDSYAKTESEDMLAEQQNLPVGKLAEAFFRFSTPRAGLLSMDPPVVRCGYTYISIADFESDHYVRTGGREKITLKLLKNEVRMLAPNIAEQDMYVRESWRDRNTGKPVVTVTETVYRFTKNRPFELGVEMAAVTYAPNGLWWTKILLQGTLH